MPNQPEHLTPQVSSRGFAHLPPLAGTYHGDQVRVYESSAADGPQLPAPPPSEKPVDNAGTILAAFIDYCGDNGVKFPKQLRGQYAKRIKEALDDGFEARQVKQALAVMFDERVANRPSLLPNKLVELQTGSMRGCPCGDQCPSRDETAPAPRRPAMNGPTEAEGEPPWAERDGAADALRGVLPIVEARARARVAEEIAQAIENDPTDTGLDISALPSLDEQRRRHVAIARLYATSPQATPGCPPSTEPAPETPREGPSAQQASRDVCPTSSLAIWEEK